MERITEAGITAALEQSSPQTATPQSLTKWQESKAAEPREIVDLIRGVELVKQIRPPLTDQQVTALTLELRKLGLSIDRLRVMAENVKRQNTYGTIALEYWIQGQLLTPEEVAEERRAMRTMLESERRELEWEVEKTIRRRVQDFKDGSKWDPLIQEMLAAEEIAREWHEKREQHFKRELERARLRLKKAGAVIRLMTEDGRSELYRVAVERKALPEDKAIREHLFMFADKLLPIMQELKLV